MVCFASSLKQQVFAFEGGGAAEEYTRAHAVGIGGNIDEVVDAVAEVDVEVSWRSPKRCIAFCFAAITVTCGFGVLVCFDFCDTDCDAIAADNRADEVVGYIESWAGVK